MDNLQEAKHINRNMGRRIEHLRVKVLFQNDDEARSEMIRLVKDMEVALKNLGFRIKDGGKMVAITEEYLSEQRAKEAEIDHLRKKSDKGDFEAWKQMVRLMASGEGS